MSNSKKEDYKASAKERKEDSQLEEYLKNLEEDASNVDILHELRIDEDVVEGSYEEEY